MVVRPYVIESGRTLVDDGLMAAVLAVGCNEMGLAEESQLRFLAVAS
jgi:hypothetical protein